MELIKLSFLEPLESLPLRRHDFNGVVMIRSILIHEEKHDPTMPTRGTSDVFALTSQDMADNYRENPYFFVSYTQD